MPVMPITETLYVTEREAWREWLQTHHASKDEIWLICPNKNSGKPCIPYVETVLEALCFGWIDGIKKTYDAGSAAQRFTPRRPKSNWTELNKERMRRLIAEGRMTPAGLAKAPDLSIESFRIAEDILAALQAEPEVWANFQQFPASYQRIRVGYIEEQRRDKVEFERRLSNFLAKTRQNKQFGTME
jgi:uncharacterized protein YdeI (YjbR/CyaY-like superfamily)